jgi:hypothetical protein
MDELQIKTALYLKMRPMRSDLLHLQEVAVRNGLFDLYRWTTRLINLISRVERERYAAYQVCLYRYKQDPPPPSAETLAHIERQNAFFVYWEQLHYLQQKQINEQASPVLTEQMQHLDAERRQLPRHILDLWHLGQQNEAKQAIYRYYRLGRDWQDLHNQRYQMVMDRFLALRETTTTN